MTAATAANRPIRAIGLSARTVGQHFAYLFASPAVCAAISKRIGDSVGCEWFEKCVWVGRHVTFTSPFGPYTMETGTYREPDMIWEVVAGFNGDVTVVFVNGLLFSFGDTARARGYVQDVIDCEYELDLLAAKRHGCTVYTYPEPATSAADADRYAF